MALSAAGVNRSWPTDGRQVCHRMAMPATRRYSFDLANDSLRHVLASSVAVLLAVAVALITTTARQPTGSRQQFLFSVGWPTIFAFTFWYSLSYWLISQLVFRGLSGSRLRARLRAGNRSKSKHRLYSALAGGPSTSIAVQFTVIVLVGVLTVALSEQFRSDPVIAAAAVAGVIGSWILMTTTFASQYALAWAEDAGLELPASRDELQFSDFGFIAVQLSTAFATSEARISSARLRRTATLHSLVAFCFSTVIVALLVSLLANSAS